MKFILHFCGVIIILFLSSYFIFKDAQYYFGNKSDHFAGKIFFNPVNNDPLEDSSNKNIISYLLSKINYEAKNGKVVWPIDYQELPDYQPKKLVNDSIISTTYVGHATFLIQFDNINILTDPIWSNRASPVGFLGPKRVKNPGIKFENLPKIDIILISHSHYDHMDLPTIKKLKKHSNPQIFAGLGVCYYLNQVKKLQVNCVEMDWNDNFKFNKNLTVNFLRSKHWSKRAMWGKNTTLWGAFALQTKKGNIYFAGDTGYDDHFAEAGRKFKRFKIALLPIGAYKPEDFMIYHHISPLQALQAHKDLRAEKSIAMHFETFKLASDGFFDAKNDLEKYKKELDLKNDFVILEVGQNLLIK